MKNVKTNYAELAVLEQKLGRKLTDTEALIAYLSGALALVKQLINNLLDALKGEEEPFAFDNESDLKEDAKFTAKDIIAGFPDNACCWLALADEYLDVEEFIDNLKNESEVLPEILSKEELDAYVGEFLDELKDAVVEKVSEDLVENHTKLKLDSEIMDEVCAYLWNTMDNVSIKIVNGEIEVR